MRFPTGILPAVLSTLTVVAAPSLFAQTLPSSVRPVHQTLSQAVSNGCDWHAQLDGTMGGADRVRADLRIGAEVACPNGERTRTATRHVQLEDADRGELAHALESAARVTAVDGTDRCNYAPALRVQGARVHSTAVGVACLPGDDEEMR